MKTSEFLARFNTSCNIDADAARKLYELNQGIFIDTESKLARLNSDEHRAWVDAHILRRDC